MLSWKYGIWGNQQYCQNPQIAVSETEIQGELNPIYKKSQQWQNL
jgi:hypothetical protein